jgi:ligand-binding sensor domain-containing protein
MSTSRRFETPAPSSGRSCQNSRTVQGVLCRRVLCIWAVLLVTGSQAQGQGLPIKVYATADGLPHNTVNRIVRDTRGFLWFCTADGLSRFDGYEFTNFGPDQGLPQAPVNDLLETSIGEYWVATDHGLVRFNPKGTPARRASNGPNGSTAKPMFQVILPDGSDQRAGAITVLRQSRDGTIWAGTRNGLYRLQFTNGHHFMRPVDIQMPADFPDQRVVADVV